MQRIEVQDLHQHTSHYLALVKQGERVEVTDQGRPVAMLVPVPSDSWEELIARGLVILPTDDTDLADEEPGDYDVDASGELAAMREDER